MRGARRWRDEEDDFRDDVTVVVVALPVSATEEDIEKATMSVADSATRKKLLRAQREGLVDE